ncbi:hypothetical protein JZ751_012758, partial [Albula glossodonta]
SGFQTFSSIRSFSFRSFRSSTVWYPFRSREEAYSCKQRLHINGKCTGSKKGENVSNDYWKPMYHLDYPGFTHIVGVTQVHVCDGPGAMG